MVVYNKTNKAIFIITDWEADPAGGPAKHKQTFCVAPYQGIDLSVLGLEPKEPVTNLLPNAELCYNPYVRGGVDAYWRDNARTRCASANTNFMEIRAIKRDGKIVIQTKEPCVKTNQTYSIFPPGTYEHHSGYLCFPGPVPFEPEKIQKIERDWVDA